MEDKKAETTQSEGKRFLFMSVGGMEYGIDLDVVQEIIVMQDISPIPGARPFCKGVINIRGTIVPVLDLRIKIGLPPCEYDEDACIVVVLVDGEKVGIVVEAVCDVVLLQQSQLRDSPARLEKGRANISSQVVSINETVKQILDIGRVFDTDQKVSESME